MLWISEPDWVALQLTLKLAVISTAILLVLCLPLAWWLAHTNSRLKVAIEALVAMPLVLPPTVIGFYLLILLGPRGAVGGFLDDIGVGHLAFSFAGLVVGSIIYSLPFAVQPLQDAFQCVGRRTMEAAATLRAGPLDRFFTVAMPLARRGFLTAAVLSFAHTLGEFGVVLMIGGNIPGQTQVASIAIYDHVEAMDFESANRVSLILLAFSFLILFAVYTLNRRMRIAHP